MKKLIKIAALGLVGVMTMSGVFACTKSPEEKVADAFKSLGTSASFTALNEELGIASVLEKIEGNSFEVGMDITLEDTDMDEIASFTSGSVNASIAGDLGDSKDDVKVLMELGVGYAASDIISALFYVDEEQIALKVPELFDKVFYMDISGNLAERFEKSALFKMAGMTEADMDMLAESLEAAYKNEGANALGEYVTDFEKETEAIETFKDAIEITEIDKKEFEINGKDRKCEGYEIVITEESIVDFADEFIDYFFSEDAKELYEDYINELAAGDVSYDVEAMLEELETYIDMITEEKDEMLSAIESYISDIEAEMYIYEGEIASLEVVMEITDETGSLGMEEIKVGLELECTGGEYSLYDNYELSIEMMNMSMLKITKQTSDSNDEYEVEWELGGMAMEDVEASCTYVINKKDGDFELNVIFDDGYSTIECNAEGTLEVEKKESMTMEFDTISVIADDELICELSGKYYVECDAEVDMPSGDKFDILTDKESDWEDLSEELEGLEDTITDLMGSFY